jgi:segregation and condensation protein B
MTNDSDHDDDAEQEFDELSLDDLGAAYARAAAEHDPDAFAHPSDDQSQLMDHRDQDEAAPSLASDEEDEVVTPESIVEAALFVGHPENQNLSEQRLASLMRGVQPEEVVAIIDRLNESYKQADQALRIVRDELGYRMTIAPSVEAVRRSFLGKVREAKLSQGAIEVLSLVAYQPGITAQVVQDQRGQDSGALLSQLVRRQLLEMRREKPEDGGRAVPHYYPTERFLTLFGLKSLDDLPQVEEGLKE